jgi:hypothetical protein
MKSFYHDLLTRHPIVWGIVAAGLIAGFLTWIIPRILRAPSRTRRLRLIKATAMGIFAILYLVALVIVGPKLLTQSATFLFVGLLLLFMGDWFSNRDKTDSLP